MSGMHRRVIAGTIGVTLVGVVGAWSGTLTSGASTATTTEYQCVKANGVVESNVYSSEGTPATCPAGDHHVSFPVTDLGDAATTTTTGSTSSTSTTTSTTTSTSPPTTTTQSTSTSTTRATTSTTTTTTLPTGTGFVGRNGTHLVLNGNVWTFTGLNIFNATSVNNCGPSFSTLNADPTGDGLDTNLTKIGPLKAFRAWFFEKLALVNGAIDWRAFDNTFTIARKHGMHVVVTLENQWQDCVNSGYKSSTWYATGYKATDGDGPLSYRSYVAQIVARYKNEPSILTWQFMNEGEDCDLAGFDAWANDIGGLVKSIDPNHLTNIGTMGSGQCGSASSTDYKNLYSSPNVDLCEYHDYGSETTLLPSRLSSDLSVCGSSGLNKPLFDGELGIKPCDVGGSFQNRADAFSAKFSAQFSAGVVGELPWNWDGGQSQQCGYLIGTLSDGSLDPTIPVLRSFG